MTADERNARIATELLALEVPEHRPGFFDELREELGASATHVSRRRSRLLALAAAAAVVAGVLAFSLTRGSEVAAAAQVRAAVERALASTGSISGIFVNNESGDLQAQGTRWRFVVSSTGAFRIDGLSSPSERVYDPATNVETTSDGSLFVRRTELATGPPDSAPADFVLQRGLGSVVSALASARDPKVEGVSYDGRPAWLLRTSTGNPGEQRLVTVDRETGVPVRNELLRDGTVTSEWRIEGLRVSSTTPAIEPLHARPGQDRQTYPSGFRRISRGEAVRLAGYAPLVPRHLPAGFALSAVAFAESSRSTGEEDGGNPPSHDVLSFAFRHGFDEIVVTTRRTGQTQSAWKDPLQVSHALSATPRRVVFTGGALAGEQGYLVLEPDALPHVWTADPRLVITVAGTVTPGELLKVANSLGLG